MGFLLPQSQTISLTPELPAHFLDQYWQRNGILDSPLTRSPFSFCKRMETTADFLFESFRFLSFRPQRFSFPLGIPFVQLVRRRDMNKCKGASHRHAPKVFSVT